MDPLQFNLLLEQRPITVIAGLCAVFYLLYRLGATRIHANEPTVIPSKAPFIGHLIGMAIYGGKYVKMIG